jgi:predicted ferric reductase
MFLKLHRQEGPSEEHPFTISASPADGCLEATVKQSGDFTNTIGRTTRDDLARIEAPFGRFSYVHNRPDAMVCIVGGVGITPIMSMLRALRDGGDTRPVAVIWGNRTEQDILFHDELQAMPPSITVVHVLSKPDEDWHGPHGYVTREVIEHYAGDLLAQDAHIYLCGPPPMMKMVRTALAEMSVPRDRIHYERFSL